MLTVKRFHLSFKAFNGIKYRKSFRHLKKYCTRSSNERINRNFKGPGLQYFINKSLGNSTSSPQIAQDIPYLDDEDLDGGGRKVYIDVRGCQMNYNDADTVWSILKNRGYEKTNELSDSDIVLLMTCSIRDSAESKIWKNLEFIKRTAKNKRPKSKIGILGCMAERLKEKILDVEKSVDLIAGPDSYKDLPRLLALLRHNVKAVNILLSIDETYADVMPMRLNENSISAYVSIMRGCDNMCTYCVVPFTRGRERSRPISSILQEVQILSDQGVKEITLLGQNVNSYRDLSSVDYYNATSNEQVVSGFKTVYKPKKGGLKFATLLDKVSLINPEMRIRFTSPHPKDFPDDVLHLIRERKNICNSIHLPAQSGSNSILEKMRRGYTRESYLNLVNQIRNILPNVALTTDIICGFCGETEEDHKDTLDLIKEVKYNFIYMFPYSLREKTTAHRRYTDNLPIEEKRNRVSHVRRLFRGIAEEINKSQIDQHQVILVEGEAARKNGLVGRNDGNTKVIISDLELPVEPDSQVKRSIKPGDYVTVLINDSTSQVLHGTPLYHTNLRDSINRSK